MTHLEVHPVAAGRWDDLCTLFGARGAYSGCWCMWWRQSRSRHAAAGNADNRRAMQDLVRGGAVPGLLAYEGAAPVGWCSVGPRAAFSSLRWIVALSR